MTEIYPRSNGKICKICSSRLQHSESILARSSVEIPWYCASILSCFTCKGRQLNHETNSWILFFTIFLSRSLPNASFQCTDQNTFSHTPCSHHYTIESMFWFSASNDNVVINCTLSSIDHFWKNWSIRRFGDIKLLVWRHKSPSQVPVGSVANPIPNHATSPCLENEKII